MSDGIAEGFCQCGCGQRTTIPTETSRKAGRVKGVPMKFVSGHNAYKRFRLRWAPDDLERLRSYLRADPVSGCLLFTGHISKAGYGHFQIGNKCVRAHRVAWLLAGKPIPPETPCVLHKCDTPACCNVEHLFLGTHRENALDKARKGRGARSRRGLPYGVRVTSAGTYQSQAKIGGVVRTFGTYTSWQEASAVASLKKNLALY